MRLLIVLLVGLCALFVIGYLQRLAVREGVQQEIAGAEAQVASARQRQAELMEKLTESENPYLVAQLARDSIGMVQEGDQPIVVLAPAPTPEPVVTPAPVEVVAPVARPVWRQWLELLAPVEGGLP